MVGCIKLEVGVWIIVFLLYVNEIVEFYLEEYVGWFVDSLLFLFVDGSGYFV